MQLTLNGAELDVDAHPMKRLLDVLREECSLPGTKEGCGEGECGACTVLIDDEPVCACLVPWAHAEGRSITTIEGLADTHPLQQAFMDHVGAQCGICTPGMILAAIALGPNPKLEKIKVGLAGNLCRCTGYEAIYRAIQSVAVFPGSGSDAESAGDLQTPRSARGGKKRARDDKP